MDIDIESVADLSIVELEELEKSEKIGYITILGKYPTICSSSEYKKIYEKLIELTDGIDTDWSQTKKFVLIYKRVSDNIEYDYIAAYPEKGNRKQEEYSDRENINCRNLRNGLLFGKCVCAGYAEILRNACLLKGVRAIEINGKAEGEEHAWNQVEIDNGKWIEVDSTWDHKQGTKNIGTNKQKFWEKHRKSSKNIVGIIESNEHIVSDFDLNAFINEEFGLNMQYTVEEQNKFINLLYKRDAKKLNITEELQGLIETVHQREKKEQEFEQECGYTIEQLKELGFDDREITQMQSKFDGKTGAELDRKAIVYEHVERRIEKEKNEKEFEQEIGYTIEQLRKIGFNDQEIEQMQSKFDSQTGEKLNRKEIIEKEIDEKNTKTAKGTIGVLTREEEENLRIQCKDLHPDIMTVLIKEIEKGYISIEDANLIVNYRKGNESRTTVDSILKRRKISIQIEKNTQFENECGYTMQQLRELGFNDQEIKQMQLKFDDKTGAIIDRKKVVEDAIIERKNKNAITLEEIGQGTVETFKNNTGKAIKAINDLEQGIEILDKTNDDIIQGED